MFKYKINKLTILFILFLSTQNYFAQLSKTHYLPPLTSANDKIDVQFIYISTPSTTPVSFTITPIGKPVSSIITGIVTNATPFVSGNENDQLFLQQTTPGVITDKGFIIEASSPVYVSVRIRSEEKNNGEDDTRRQAAAIVSKGSSAFGTEFRTGGFANDGSGNSYLNFISVIATEDNTSVTFPETTALVGIDGYTGAYPVSINLNKGESYILTATKNNTNKLIGTLIQSDKSIVVNCGSTLGSFDKGSKVDYGIDQIVGSDKIGKEYIFVRGAGYDKFENILIIPNEDNTDIYVNGNTTPIASKNKGEYYVIEGDSYDNNGNMYVNTSKKTYAYQGIGGSEGNATDTDTAEHNAAANQAMFFVPPINCESIGNVNNIASIDKIGNTVFEGGITIVTEKDATVKINDALITAPLFPVTGNANYVTYKIEGLTGNIKVESDKQLYCAYFNRNSSASSGSFFSGFPSAPEINFNSGAATTTSGNCIPNVTLDAANTDVFTSLEWYYDDGNGAGLVSTGITTPSFTPSVPGEYQLIGNTCSNTLKSAIVSVSMCPGDNDGDGVIDNIDIDLDNDGILNCDESNGDVTIDLTDINTPSTSQPVVITSVFNETNANTFIGDLNGNFTSTLSTSGSSRLDYKLGFNEKINLAFTEATATSHTIIDEETFIVKIGPTGKNITLIDPDDKLLVDTNNDGIYETGVTEITTTEIKFMYNATPTGTTPFKFLANHVTSITFEHYSQNLTDISTFSGNILLTCFAKDSDGDGIEDSLDTDSDNDGVPDIYEASSSLIVLLNTDTNLDGLDDVFNGMPNNSDTDNDGILNYLDTDSDNDGIFDLIEAGHNALDTDNDGVIDDAILNIGSNGLVDDLEKNPNTNPLDINYLVLDSDSDEIFDFLDSDSDNDGIPDIDETDIDTDKDGISNYLDLDSDNDEIFDLIEAGHNALDADNDGLIDNAITNIGTNGLVDTLETDMDVNPIAINYTILDSDNDGILNYLDLDSDNDGIPDVNETALDNDNDGILNYLDLDADNDGILDIIEAGHNALDTDNDGVIDNSITNIGTNGLVDTLETVADADPLTINYTILDKDNDGVLNFLDSDSDNDGIPDVNEKDIDTDNDGTSDYLDLDADNDGIFDLIEAGHNALDANKDGVIDDAATNIGANGLVDALETVADANPLALNYVILDSDNDGILNYIDLDADNDGILDIEESTIDTDNDGLLNYIELDSDNDTCFDVIEAGFTDNNNDGILGNIPSPTVDSNGKIIGATDGYTTPNSNYTIGAPIIINTPLVNQSFCEFSTNQIIADSNADTFQWQESTDGITWINLANNSIFNNVSTASLTITNSPYSLNSKQYRVILGKTGNSCGLTSSALTLTINSLPDFTSPVSLEQCDLGIETTINLTEAESIISATYLTDSFEYFTSEANANAGTQQITDIINYPVNTIGQVWVKITPNAANSCSGIAIINTTLSPAANNPYNDTFYSCDDFLDADGNNTAANSNTDGISSFDFSIAPSQISIDPNVDVLFYESDTERAQSLNAIQETQSISNYRNKNIPNLSGTPIPIYYKLKSKTNSNCLGIGVIYLQLNQPPNFEVEPTVTACLNMLPKTLSIVSSGAIYNYEWKDPNGLLISTNSTADISISAEDILEGNYSVTAITKDIPYCTKTKTITVTKSNIPIIKENLVTITSDSKNSTISINDFNNNLGVGYYEYQLTNESGEIIRPYQDQPIFENLSGGIYNIFVNDKDGCGTSLPLQVSIIEFPKFFTPNGDGKNDTWNIIGLNSSFYILSDIKIFNRYGKIVAEVTVDGQGWNGKYNGKILSSNDYWFSAHLIPVNPNKPSILKKGHFSLLRK